jgi:hypothetical protein
MFFAAFRCRLPVLLVLVLGSQFVGRMEAQAWLNPKGEASLTIGFGNIFVRDHYQDNATSFDDGHIRTNTVGLNLEYGISDRFSIDFGIPYVISKYYATNTALFGPDPHIALDGSTLDDSTYHGDFQDFRLALRWQALKVPVVLTPYVAAIVPSHDYRYFAHSAVGRDLRQYILGFYVARRLDPILENGWAELRYSYAFVQEVIGIHHDLSTADLQVGYFLTSALGARAILSYGYTHGGLDFPDVTTQAGYNEFVRRFCDPVLQCAPGAGDSTPAWLHHDQIGHDVYLNVGGGLSYALTGSIDVFVAYLTSVYGLNGHKLKDSWSLGFTWNFSPARLVRQLTGKSASGQ